MNRLRWAILFALGMLLCWATTHAQTPQNTITSSRHRNIHATDPNMKIPNPAREVTVCSAGCDATVICGTTAHLTCASPSVTCTAASAIEKARALSPSITSPVTIRVAAGVYSECVVVDNITDLTIYGEGVDATFVGVQPLYVTSYESDGGSFRIAPITGTKNATARIEVSHMTIQNDVGDSPAAAVILGLKNGYSNNTASGWTDVYFHDVRLIGARQGIRIAQSTLSTDTDLPRFRMDTFEAIGGGAGIVEFLDFGVPLVENGTIRYMSNYCEASDPNYLDAETGTVVSGMSVRVLTIPDPAGSEPNEVFLGRKITLADADGGGGGECGAGNAAVGDYWIARYHSADDSISFTPDAAVAPTSGCSFTIVGVPNTGAAGVLSTSIQPPCTRLDWSLGNGLQVDDPNGIDPNAPALPAVIFYGGAGIAFQRGAGTGATLNSPTAAVARVRNVSVFMDLNDIGPRNTATTCTATSVSSVAGFAGIAFVGRVSWHIIDISDVDVIMNINSDIHDGLFCPETVGGVITWGQPETDGYFQVSDSRLMINNYGDTDTGLYGVATSSNASLEVILDNVYIDINDIAVTSGAKIHLYEANAGTLTVGSITSDAAITTSGTIAGLRRGFNGSLTEDIGVVATCLDSTGSITVTGAAFGDACSVTTSVATTANQAVTCKVTAADTVKVNVCGAGDPPNTTYTVSIEKK